MFTDIRAFLNNKKNVFNLKLFLFSFLINYKYVPQSFFPLKCSLTMFISKEIIWRLEKKITWFLHICHKVIRNINHRALSQTKTNFKNSNVITVQRNKINNFLSSLKLLFSLISKDGNYRKLYINYTPKLCQMKI